MSGRDGVEGGLVRLTGLILGLFFLCFVACVGGIGLFGVFFAFWVLLVRWILLFFIGFACFLLGWSYWECCGRRWGRSFVRGAVRELKRKVYPYLLEACAGKAVLP